MHAFFRSPQFIHSEKAPEWIENKYAWCAQYAITHNDDFIHVNMLPNIGGNQIIYADLVGKLEIFGTHRSQSLRIDSKKKNKKTISV